MLTKTIILCLLWLLSAPTTRAENGWKTIHNNDEWQCLDSVKWQRPDTTRRKRRYQQNAGEKKKDTMNDVDTKLHRTTTIQLYGDGTEHKQL